MNNTKHNFQDIFTEDAEHTNTTYAYCKFLKHICTLYNTTDTLCNNPTLAAAAVHTIDRLSYSQMMQPEGIPAEGAAVGDSQLEVGVQLVAGEEGMFLGGSMLEEGMQLVFQEEGTIAGQSMLEEGMVVGVGQREVGHPVACSQDSRQDRLSVYQPGLS